MKFFAIRFYGECVGGADEAKLTSLLISGEGHSNTCNNIGHTLCTNHNGGKECVGVAGSDYLYRVVQHDESSKSSFSFEVLFSYCTVSMERSSSLKRCLKFYLCFLLFPKNSNLHRKGKLRSENSKVLFYKQLSLPSFRRKRWIYRMV